GIAGVVIDLDGIAVATTDANGNYNIGQVGPGTHILTEVLPKGQIVTTPSTGSYSLTTSSGANLLGKNFGNLTGFQSVDNGDPNYAEFGPGWTTLNAGWNGTSRVHAAVPSGQPPAVRWGFKTTSNVPAASYEIFVTYQSDPSRDPRAAYFILYP